LETTEELRNFLNAATGGDVCCIVVQHGHSFRPDRIDHMLFTVSGNAPPAALRNDLEATGTERGQYVVNLRIEDHQEFIADMYEKALKLGDD
jgi:hypothetical protein